MTVVAKWLRSSEQDLYVGRLAGGAAMTMADTIEKRAAWLRATCVRHGHDFEVATEPPVWPACSQVRRLTALEPLYVACRRCGENWAVIGEEDRSLKDAGRARPGATSGSRVGPGGRRLSPCPVAARHAGPGGSPTRSPA